MRLFLLFIHFLVFPCFAFSDTKVLSNGIALESTFTSSGKLQSLISSDGSICHTFEYDEQDRLISGSTLETHFERVYNLHGDLLEEKWSTGLSYRKKYGEDNRPIEILLPAAKTIQIGYSHEHLTSISYGRYIHTFNAYDLQGRLLDESLPADLGIIKRSYNAEGFPTSLISPFLTQDITYDAKNRPIHVTTNGKEISYTYDEKGQLNSEGQLTYTFNDRYHPIQVEGVSADVNEQGQVEKIGNNKCLYDEKGCLIQKETPHRIIQYHYDLLSQLTCVETSERQIQFIYDALGRRVSKSVYSLSPNGWEKIAHENYLFDGIWEIGTYTPEGIPKEVRVLNPDNPLQTVFLEQKEEVSFPLNSPQGHALCLIFPSGEVDYALPYTAFGKTEYPWLHPWAYSGHFFDLESGLFYFGKRFYDPQLFTWMTPDPAGPLDSDNLYQYLLNNPLCYVDLDGQWAILIPIVATTLREFLKSAVQAIITVVVGVTASKVKDAVTEAKRTSEEIKTSEDVYAPDRPLPMTEDGVPIPDIDAPHTQLGTERGSKGKYPKAREFDETGEPVREIEFTDHGRPHDHPNPHQHPRKENPTGGTRIRDDAEPLPGWRYE